MAQTPEAHSDRSSEINAESTPEFIQAQGQDVIALPDSDFVKNSEITRDGQDLVLEGPDGSVIVIEGYFNADPAPLLQAEDGQALSPALVESFVQTSGPLQYAQAGTDNDESPVGAVKEVSGHSIVTHIDGSTETITIGTPIYEADIIETSADGAVNITFVDETSFAVSQSAKLAIDEYVFDPATESGSSDFSVLRGLFVFTSGLIGRSDPDDVTIDTPMGSIGIRGTTIVGNVDSGEITIMEGAIVLRGFSGHELTITEQFETGRFEPATGEVIYLGKTTVDDFSNSYDTLKPVAPDFFSGLNNNTGNESNNPIDGGAGEQRDDNDAAPDGAAADTPAAPTTGEATPTEGTPSPQQNANHAANPNHAPLDTLLANIQSAGTGHGIFHGAGGGNTGVLHNLLTQLGHGNGNGGGAGHLHNLLAQNGNGNGNGNGNNQPPPADLLPPPPDVLHHPLPPAVTTHIGTSGDDTFVAINDGGHSLFIGGGNTSVGDTVDYNTAGSGSGITVDLALTGFQAIGGGFGSDKLLGIENIKGTNFNDTLKGNAADNNKLQGFAGNDTFIATPGGNNTIDGGTNTATGDTYDASAIAGSITINSTLDQVSFGAGKMDMLTNIESIRGNGAKTTYHAALGTTITVNLLAHTVNTAPGTQIFDIGKFVGSDQNDTFTSGLQNVTFDGRAAIDTYISTVASTIEITGAGAGAATVTHSTFTDKLFNIETIQASDGASDTFEVAGTGGLANQTIDGGITTDAFGNDVYTDVLDFSAISSPVTFTLSAPNAGSANSINFTNIEELVGSGSDDTFRLTNSSFAENINAGAGIDTLSIKNSALDLRSNPGQISHIEKLDMAGLSGTQILTLSKANIISLLSSTDNGKITINDTGAGTAILQIDNQNGLSDAISGLPANIAAAVGGTSNTAADTLDATHLHFDVGGGTNNLLIDVNLNTTII